MKRFWREFLRRGMTAMGLGPLVLAVLYLIQQPGGQTALTANQVCLGIFSLSALAFVAGGMNSIYQIERLPLMVAVLIHGGVLYVTYLATYLLNNWLVWDRISVLAFSAIFGIGYLGIWAVIYSIIRRKTENLNRILRQKQQGEEISG